MNIIYGLIALNTAAWIIQQTGALAVSQALAFTPTTMQDLFSIASFDTVTAIATGLGGIAALIALMAKQYTFAAGIIGLWILAELWKPTNAFLNSIPNMAYALLPASLWWISVIPQMFVAVGFFFFLAGIVRGTEIQ